VFKGLSKILTEVSVQTLYPALGQRKIKRSPTKLARCMCLNKSVQGLLQSSIVDYSFT